MSSSSARASPPRQSRSSRVTVPAAELIRSEETLADPSESSTPSLTGETIGLSITLGVESHRLAQVEELFAQAVDLPRAERDAFLAAARVDDEIRAEVRSLIDAEAGARSVKSIVATALAAPAAAMPGLLAG